jgi:hypothetical protein
LSEKDASFQCLSETLKGFNYRDYGVEFGPIIKLDRIKKYSVIHPAQGSGLLSMTELVAEGSEEHTSLSPTLKQYLTCLHPS